MKKRNGRYWAVELAGEQVRLCRFHVEGEQVVVDECETRPAADFDFERFRQEKAAERSRDARILLAVPRSEVLLKPFVAPRGEQVDLSKITALKLEQALGALDPATTLWGYTEDGTADGGKRARVMAAAISRSYVEDLLARLFKEGDRPAVVECGALAAVRAHRALQPQPLHCEVVVDCAPDGMSLFVIQEGVIESAHFIPGNRPLEAAVNEIRRLIVFLRGKRESTIVEAVTCLGGETAEGLAAELRRELEIPIASRLEPSCWIASSEALPADWNCQWHRVIGMMQAARNGRYEAINFLALEAPRGRVSPFQPLLEQLGTPFLAVGLVGLMAATFFVNHWLGDRRDGIMDRVIGRSRQITADLQRSEKALLILKKYSTERFSLTKILVEIADIAPPRITLDTLTLNADGSLAITGRCRSYSEGQEFMRKLNASDLFTKAEAPSLRKERDSITFKMTFSLSPKVRKVNKK